MKRRILGLLLALLVACGGDARHWDGDPDLHGIKLVVNSDPALYPSDPSFRARFKRVVERTAEFYGFDVGQLAGLRVVYLDEGLDWCVAGYHATGCFRRDEFTVWVTAGAFSSVEASVLPHELLHALIGDYDHAGPEWCRLNDLQRELIEGYPVFGRSLPDWCPRRGS